jgi:hypothetical protein
LVFCGALLLGAADQAAEVTVLENRALRLEVGQKPAAYIERLTHKGSGVAVIAAPANKNLFSLTLANADGNTVTLEGSQAGASAVRQEGDKLTLQFGKFSNADLKVEATVTCAADDTQSFWSLRIENKTGMQLKAVRYPQDLAYQNRAAGVYLAGTDAEGQPQSQAVFTKGQPAASLRALWQKMQDERPRGARFIRYTENHDIVNDLLRAEVVMGERGAAALTAVHFTLDGVPLLYNGQEIGDTSLQSIYARWPVRWEAACLPKAQAKLAFHQKLCQLRRTEPALATGEVVWLDNDQPDAVISFARRAGGAELVTVANLSNRKVKVQVESSAKLAPLLSASVTPALTSDKLVLTFDTCGYFIGKAQ